MATIIEMPKLSDTMTDGILVKWLKQEGAAVKTGDMLAEVETDKATMELESFFDGTLIKIFVAAGERVPIGGPLCAIGKPGEVVTAPKPVDSGRSTVDGGQKAAGSGQMTDDNGRKTEDGGRKAVEGGQKTVGGGQTIAPAPAATGGRIRISPLARKLAAEKRIDPTSIAGSGPGGRIVRADVLAAEKAGPSKASASRPGAVSTTTDVIQEDKLVPVSNMRATIARRLVEAKSSIPHFYLDIEIDAAPLLEMRTQLNTSLEKDGIKLSVNDFVIKAAAEALRKVPAVNCSWDPAGPAIRQHGSAHVSFAVAIDDGLITPVIRDTQTKSLAAISIEVKALAKRAREKKLAPAEFTGGTFCVTNLGMMGIDRFSAIINPPNAAILAVGTTVTKPVVEGDRIVIGQRMNLTLSGDHRVVDGATGATYLAAVKDLLEKPALLLL